MLRTALQASTCSFSSTGTSGQGSSKKTFAEFVRNTFRTGIDRQFMWCQEWRKHLSSSSQTFHFPYSRFHVLPITLLCCTVPTTTRVTLQTQQRHMSHTVGLVSTSAMCWGKSIIPPATRPLALHAWAGTSIPHNWGSTRASVQFWLIPSTHSRKPWTFCHRI